MDRRVTFFLVAALVCGLLVPLAPGEFRIVCEVTAGAYVLLAGATALDQWSRHRELREIDRAGHAGRFGRDPEGEDGRPVWCCHAVDTPPTSHRSQIVNSGSIPMPACSAACSVPGTDSALMPASTNTRSSTVYQKARVTSVVGGRSRSSSPNTSPLNR